jgi:hypothetical protein
MGSEERSSSRRRFLKCGVPALAVGIAGCSNFGQSDDSGATRLPDTERPDPDTPRPTTAPPTTTAQPTVSWREEEVEDGVFEVWASGKMNGAAKLSFETMGGLGLGSVSEDGSYSVKIAGEGTGNPYLRELAFVVAYVGDDPVGNQVAEHVVGSDESGENQTTEETETSQQTGFLDGLRGTNGPEQDVSGEVRRAFETDINGETYTNEALIQQRIVDYFENRARTRDYGAYVADRIDTQAMQLFASTIQVQYQGEENATAKKLGHTMAMVQQMEYTSDSVTTGFDEYPRYPVETVVDRGGDCEDTSLLMAALLKQLGYGTVILKLPNKAHVAVGVKGDESIEDSYVTYNGDRYYYLETTGDGWFPGQIPSDYEGADVEIEPVDSDPVLVFSYEFQNRGGEIRVGMFFQNVGTTGTNAARGVVELQNEAGNIVDSAQTDALSVGRGQRIGPRELTLSPTNERLRARVGVTIDGTLHDFVVSDYRSPN